MDVDNARRWLRRELKTLNVSAAGKTRVAAHLAEPLAKLTERARPAKEDALQFTLRIPPELHRDISGDASVLKKTLNKHILDVLKAGRT